MRYLSILSVLFLFAACDSATSPSEQAPRVFHASFDFSGDAAGSFLVDTNTATTTQYVRETKLGEESISYMVSVLADTTVNNFYITLTYRDKVGMGQRFSSSDIRYNAHLTFDS